MEHVPVHLVQMTEQIGNHLKREMLSYMDATHWKVSTLIFSGPLWDHYPYQRELPLRWAGCTESEAVKQIQKYYLCGKTVALYWTDTPNVLCRRGQQTK